MLKVSLYISLVAALLASACTKRINQCESDADCTNPAYPFCDVDGQYEASGGQKNVCTIVPPNCPVSRCGCDPGAASCGSDTLLTCNADGKSQTMATCSLGCEGDGTACKTFEPSNGLGTALAAASSQPDVQFPASVTIDTDTGTIVDSANLPVTVASVTVTQSNAAIRVFIAKSFDITNAVIYGTDAVAFVAAGSIEIHGYVDASANLSTSGPGAVTADSPCVGESTATGGGGGGNATAGGNGTTDLLMTGSGGSMQAAFSPLLGGCVGGGDTNGAEGGGGGGAIQFVAGTELGLDGSGTIDIGGGGGGASASGGGGGGAGGTVVIEAPSVALGGTIAANGASGGACAIDGDDATPTATPAPSVQGCSTTTTKGFVYDGYSGAGGTASSAPGNGYYYAEAGGPAGGGSVGWLRVATGDGTYATTATALLSVAIVTATLETE